MATILVSTHGTAGDVVPFIEVGRALRALGHRVTLATHAPYADRAAAAGLEFVPVDTEHGYQRHLDQAPAPDGLADQVRTEVAVLAARRRPGDTVLVGRHASALSVLVAAELLGVPAVRVALAPTQLRTAPVTAPGAGLTVGLWPSWFDRAGPAADPDVELAGFALPSGGGLHGAVADLVAELPAPVLVTGGTVRMPHPGFYRAAVDGVVAAGATAVLVTSHRRLVPDPLPPGVHWFPALPFAALMPRVHAVVHHGGIGTAAQALLAGTPQLVLAHGGDRPDNAARLARLGLATWLPTTSWRPATVAAGVDEVRRDGGYRRRAAAACATGFDGAAAAAAAITGVLDGPAAWKVVPR